MFRQEGRRAGALVAEMEVEADRRAADAEAADQDALDEIGRRGGGKLGVEGHDDGAVEPARRQQAQPVALAGELEQRVLRAQEHARMRRERQRRRLAAERLGALERGADHGAVAAMHAVEVADRHHAAVQRADIAALPVAGDVKAGRIAHFDAMPPFRAATVSARLTNFQISRLLKAT